MSALALSNKKWLLEAQVEPGQNAFDLQPDEIKQDLLNGILKLRERNLLKRNAEIRFLLEDSDEADTRVYQLAAGKTISALSRLQRMLSPKPPGEHQSLRGSTYLENTVLT